MIFNTLIFNTTITYTSEVYPTYVRDYSSGFMNCLGNFGAMISQPLFILYSYMGLKVPYVFCAIFFIMSACCFYALPYETRGNELDYEEDDVKIVQKTNKNFKNDKITNEKEYYVNNDDNLNEITINIKN